MFNADAGIVDALSEAGRTADAAKIDGISETTHSTGGLKPAIGARCDERPATAMPVRPVSIPHVNGNLTVVVANQKLRGTDFTTLPNVPSRLRAQSPSSSVTRPRHARILASSCRPGLYPAPPPSNRDP